MYANQAVALMADVFREMRPAFDSAGARPQSEIASLVELVAAQTHLMANFGYITPVLHAQVKVAVQKHRDYLRTLSPEDQDEEIRVALRDGPPESERDARQPEPSPPPPTSAPPATPGPPAGGADLTPPSSPPSANIAFSIDPALRQLSTGVKGKITGTKAYQMQQYEYGMIGHVKGATEATKKYLLEYINAWRKNYKVVAGMVLLGGASTFYSFGLLPGLCGLASEIPGPLYKLCVLNKAVQDCRNGWFPEGMCLALKGVKAHPNANAANLVANVLQSPLANPVTNLLRSGLFSYAGLAAVAFGFGALVLTAYLQYDSNDRKESYLKSNPKRFGVERHEKIKVAIQELLKFHTSDPNKAKLSKFFTDADDAIREWPEDRDDSTGIDARVQMVSDAIGKLLAVQNGLEADPFKWTEEFAKESKKFTDYKKQANSWRAKIEDKKPKWLANPNPATSDFLDQVNCWNAMYNHAVAKFSTRPLSTEYLKSLTIAMYMLIGVGELIARSTSIQDALDDVKEAVEGLLKTHEPIFGGLCPPSGGGGGAATKKTKPGKNKKAKVAYFNGSPWVKELDQNISVVDEAFSKFGLGSTTSCGLSPRLGVVMPCGVVFITDTVSFVVTTKFRDDLDPDEKLFDVAATTPEMTVVNDVMNVAARPTTYRSIFVFKEQINRKQLLATLPYMKSKPYEFDAGGDHFSKVRDKLKAEFGGDSRMVMFRYGNY